MTEKKRRALILLPWISLPIVLAGYAILWNRLPERLAVHFEWSGAANGWMSRGQALASQAVILLFALVSFSLKLRSRKNKDAIRTIVAYYAAVVIITAVFLWILIYNA